jgi:hypothetical protein
MVQSRGRPALGEGKSLKMTVLVDPAMVQALDLAMEDMRVTMAGVRIDRSTAVRHLLSKALQPYVRTSMEADQSLPTSAPAADQHRTTGRTGRKRTAAKG